MLRPDRVKTKRWNTSGDPVFPRNAPDCRPQHGDLGMVAKRYERSDGHWDKIASLAPRKAGDPDVLPVHPAMRWRPECSFYSVRVAP